MYFLVALLLFSCKCLVLWLFLTVPLVGLTISKSKSLGLSFIVNFGRNNIIRNRQMQVQNAALAKGIGFLTLEL